MAVEERLAEITAREENASGGPWHVKDNYGGDDIWVGEPGDNRWGSLLHAAYVSEIDKHLAFVGRGGTDEDAPFIAHARADVPYLLDLVKGFQSGLLLLKVLIKDPGIRNAIDVALAFDPEAEDAQA